MAKKVIVNKLITSDLEVGVLINSENLMNKQIQPEGRMLADSDHLSFIYILDVEDDFIYLSFPRDVWSDLNIALSKKLPLYLHVNDQRVPLIQFIEELQYLIENIKENSNYGNSMVEAVSTTFRIEK